MGTSDIYMGGTKIKIERSQNKATINLKPKHTVLKSLKIRLYPNTEQTTQINQLLGCYRFVYNRCLALKKEKYEKEKTSLGLKQLGGYFHNELTKDPDCVWLQDQNSKVLKQAIINLLEAYGNFFGGKGKTGFPKFKSKHGNKASCRFPLEAISKKNDYASNKLSLANIKHIKFKTSKAYKAHLTKHKAAIKSATLTKNPSGNYYLSILVDATIDKKLPPSTNTTGLDLGIKTFVTTSEGQKHPNPQFHKKTENKLKRLQRQLARKTKGSNNRNKARLRLAKAHEKITNQKTNYLHSVSNALLRENQTVGMEDLNVKGMMANHCLAKAIQGLSLHQFRHQMTYKAQWYGRDLVLVDRFFPSSKLCSNCNHKNTALTLKDREWTCFACGAHHDRDENAAKNTKKETIRTIGHRMPEYTLEDCPLMDDPALTGALKSHGRMIQEDGACDIL